MRLTETFNLATLEFSSYTEALEYAFTHKDDAPSATIEGATRIERNSNRESFYGTPDYAEAHKLATTGWRLGADAIKKFEKRIDLAGEVVKPEVYYDVIGEGGLDMGRYYSDEPECFMDWRDSPDTTFSRQIKMCVNISAAAGVSTESITRRGAATIALIEALETAGIRVELEAVKINEQAFSSKSIYIRMPLKSADNTLVADTVAFALCHPSSNRRIGFSLTHMCGSIGQCIAASGYGGTSSFKPECDIFLGRLEHTSNFNSDDDAIAWITSELTKHGVELK